MPALVTSAYNNGYGKSAEKTDLIINTNVSDAFLVRYDLNGTAVWSARIAGSGSETAWAVTTDGNNNLFVAGQSGSATTVTLYNSDGTGSGKMMGNSGATDAFVAKYHTSGRALWIARIGGTGTDIGYSVSTDSSGNAYVVGVQGNAILTAFNADGTAFGTTLPLRATEEAFIVKYDPNGSVLWVAQIGSATANTNEIGYGVIVDKPTGDLYVVGQYEGITTAYNSDGTSFGTTLPTTGIQAFIVKYNSSGFVQWVTRVDAANTDYARSVAIDSSGNIYVLGVTSATNVQTTIAYNSDGTAFATQPTGLGGGDCFVVEYNSSGFVQWIVVVGTTSSSPSDFPYSILLDSSSNVYVSVQYATTTVSTRLIKLNPSTGATVWLSGIDSDSNSDFLWGLAVDAAGDIYVGFSAGSGSTRVRDAANTIIFTVSNIWATAAAGYVIKYDSSGTPLWVRRFANANAVTLYRMTCGSSNDLYVLGTGTGSSLPVLGQQMAAFSSIANSGGTDGFVVKYNTNGAPQWVARIASSGDDIVYGTATDGLGNMYATGQTGSGAVTTFYNADTSAFATTLTSTGNDVFIVKYSTNGVVQWVASITSTGTDIGWAIATDPSGNIYVTGQGGAATLTAKNSDGTSFSPALTDGGAGDAFVVKYNTSGFVQWNARIESTQADIGYGIATDSSGNVYVTGQAGTGVTTRIRNADDTTFGSLATLTGTDVFVAKYNTSGTVQWIARIGSTGTDVGRSITTDPNGNVYITGQGGSATVDAYEGGDGTGASFGNVTNTGSGDAFIVKYDTNGVGQWITKIASTTADIGYGITADALGNVYIGVRVGAAITTAFSVGNIAFPITIPAGTGNEVGIVKYNSTGSVQWITRVSSGANESVWGLKSDRNGNVYVVGQFGPAGTDLVVYNSDGTTFASIFESCSIVKYDTNGFGQWVQILRGTTTGVNVYGISTDLFQNIYVGGSTISGQAMTIYSVDFKPYITLQSQRGNQEGFLIKYSPVGTPQWASVLSTAGVDELYAVATDSSGNVYATGQYGSGTMYLYNGDGTFFTPTLAVSGTLDGIVLKYNTKGTIQWRARIFGTGSELGYGISTDASGNVYVTGSTGSATSTTFVNSDDTTTAAVITTGGLVDGFIVKYNTSGTVQWRVKIASTSSDIGYAIANDSSGNVYITGQAGAATFFNADDSTGASITTAGSFEMFVTKYNTNGTFQWVAKLSTINADLGYGIAVDSSGNVYMTGVQQNNVSGSPQTLTITNADGTTFPTTYTGLGGRDCITVKFNNSGIAQWVTRVAGTGNDEVGTAIAVDSSANVYVVGRYFGNPTANIYQADGTTVWATITSSGGGNIDSFIVKYDTNGNPQWVARIASPSSSIETSYAVATDTAGNVYVAGFAVTQRIWAFNGGVGSAGMTLFGSFMFASNTATSANTWLVKYNSSGQVQYITGFVFGSGYDEPRGLALDSSGNIYMCGGFAESALIPESTAP